MRTMTLAQFKVAARTQMFTVCFTKRTDGTRRVMNARFGVTKHLRGGVLAYNPAEKRLLGCYDMKGNPNGESEAGYKMINLLTLVWLKWDHAVWGWDAKNDTFAEQVGVTDPELLETA